MSEQIIIISRVIYKGKMKYGIVMRNKNQKEW
jgi:hypothetical protein